MMTDEQLSNWQQFLLTQGAGFDQEGVSCYPADTTTTADVPPESWLTDLNFYGLISVQGPDTSKFLQGQFTCDCNMISPQKSALGAYCTPQGRMLSSFRVMQLESDRYLLRMQQGVVESTRKTLEKYGVFYKSQIKTCEGMVGIGVVGSQARAALQAVFNKTPQDREESLLVEGHVLIQLDTHGQRFECWLRAGEAQTIWQRLASLLPVRGSGWWNLLTIQAGIGEVCARTVEAFIPQMLNLQAVGAISFDKGCYTGQEVVARTQYRGHLKRHMYRLTTASDAAIAAGDRIFRQDGEQSVGNVVMAARSGPREQQLLAVIGSQEEASTEFRLHAADGPVLTLLSLPYERGQI